MKINQEQYKLIDNILCNEKELDNLKKNSLQIPEMEIKSHKWEKKIQDIIKTYFEYNLNIEIIEEEFKNIPQLQEHNYLLIDELIYAISSLNEDIFNNFKHISKQDIIDKILEDFIYKFDKSKNNLEKHNLYFDLKSKTISLKDKDGNDKVIYYKVLDLNKYSSSNNKITIIKEKKIVDKGILKESEFPDFAYYVNGIPFIAIEVKTPETGIKAATSDYFNKKTYHKFLACLGTDGDKSFLSTNPNFNDMFLWANYGNKISNGGLKDISEELLFNKENLLFYFQFATLPINSEDFPYLKNARVQQYFVLKYYKEHFDKLLIKKENNKKITFKNYFKHHTRTGKSFTFKLILNLLGNSSNKKGNKYNKLFRKIYILTHDLTVKRNLTKEFSNHNFGEYLDLKYISNRNEYINSIYDTYEIKDIKNNKDLNGKNIYLLNIQKTELPKKEINESLTDKMKVNENILNKKLKKRKIKNENIYKGDDVLFLIDEIHTHQNMESGYGYVRDETFPNASYITATATPAIIEKEDQLINMTSEYFGEEIDNFSPSDAIKLEIVVPLLYEKYLWTLKDSDEEGLKFLKLRISKLDDIAKQRATLKILGGKFEKEGFLIEEEGQIDNIIKEVSNDYSTKLIFKKEKDIYSILIEILKDNYYTKEDNDGKRLYFTDKKYYEKYGSTNIDNIIRLFEEHKKLKINYLYKRQKEELMYQLNRDLIPFKLNLIIEDIKFLKEQTHFKPKFFWVVDDVKTAISILTYIKQITDSKQNIYKDIRFGIDVSSIKLENLDKEDKTYLERNEIKWKEINGKYILKSSNTKYKSDAITDFESDKEGTIDVLIIVGKYLMGYDLDKLIKVYLDTKIKDIKKIIQVVTRGSTKKDNKEQSFVLDLTLDNETKAVYEKALSIYDDSDGINAFAIDDKIVQECLKSLEKSFENIVLFFKSKTIELIKEKIDIKDYSNDINNKDDFLKNKYNMIETLIEISNYKIKNISKPNYDIENDSYWKEIKEINQILKTLISPKYFINGKINLFKYIETIMEINTIYFSKILYKDEKDSISFSNEEIKKMIKDTFGILSIEFGETFNKINDILKFEYTNIENIHKIDSKTKVEIKSSLYRISEQLKTPPLSKDISTQIFSLIDEIDNNKDILENYRKVQELTEKEFKQIIRTIENDYENDIVFYIVDNYLKEYNNKLIKENSHFNNIIKSFSRIYSQKINDLINEDTIINKSEDEKITIIIDNLKLSNIQEVVRNLTKKEMSLLLTSDYKKNYIDKKEYKLLFNQIIIEIFNKELIYEYFFNKDNLNE